MIRRAFLVAGVAGAVTVASTSLSTAYAQTGKDLAVIRDRIEAPLLENVNADAASALVTSQKADGTWPDVDYADTNPGNWKTTAHLSKVLVLARAYRSPSTQLKGDKAIHAAALKGLDWWLEHDLTNSNWWWNQIGVPGSLARTMLLLDSDITGEKREIGIKILERAKIAMTGANLVDVAYITVMRGLIENKPEVVDQAVGSIVNEIRIETGEGIQPDFSFHQHGALLYNHGYGAVFMENCSDLAVIVNGTRFAFPKEKIDILNGLILDGTQWMVRFATKDYGATGRGITRTSGRNMSAGYLKSVVDNMLQLPTGREQEYRDFRTRLDGESGPPLIGNRSFWRSDYMAHQRPGWFASARMFSDRLLSTDALINSEGYASHHLGDGCTYIMQSGMEYHDIFPVWDWRMIPGTTEEMTPLTGNVQRKGSRPYAGGVSNGLYGAAAFDFERDGLTARKAWFLFDSEFVCLGAGIACKTGNDVVTTVNQCFLRGSVLAPGGARPKALPYGSHELDGAGFVVHDGIAYVFPGSQHVRLENGPKSGSWWDINHQYSKDTVTHDTFTLSIDHGTQPRSERYAYIVAPGLASDRLADYTARPPVEIVSNEPDCQAVRQTGIGITAAAFYAPGTVKAGGRTFTVDKPSMMLVRETKASSLEISASSPEHAEGVLTVTIAMEGKNTSIPVRFELPSGMYAGQSITKTVEVPR